jgi:hypothetical protein
MKKTYQLLASLGVLVSLFLSGTTSVVAKKSSSTSAIKAKILSSSDVASGFLKAGLPIDEVVSHTAKTDPNRLLGRPGYYTSKTDFRDLRYYKDDTDEWDGDNHTIEVFPTAAAALSRKQYVERVTKGIPFLVQYLILRGRVLVRIDRVMTPEEVQQYSNALDKMLR